MFQRMSGTPLVNSFQMSNLILSQNFWIVRNSVFQSGGIEIEYTY